MREEGGGKEGEGREEGRERRGKGNVMEGPEGGEGKRDGGKAVMGVMEGKRRGWEKEGGGEEVPDPTHKSVSKMLPRSQLVPGYDAEQSVTNRRKGRGGRG